MLHIPLQAGAQSVSQPPTPAARAVVGDDRMLLGLDAASVRQKTNGLEGASQVGKRSDYTCQYWPTAAEEISPLFNQRAIGVP